MIGTGRLQSAFVIFQAVDGLKNARRSFVFTVTRRLLLLQTPPAVQVSQSHESFVPRSC